LPLSACFPERHEEKSVNGPSDCPPGETEAFCNKIDVFNNGETRLTARGCAADYECTENKCVEFEEPGSPYTARHCCCGEDMCNTGMRTSLLSVVVSFAFLLVSFDFLA
ncbi:hypothetical protein ANCCAN_05080, partial [Ancylostoma caninum]